MRNFDEKIRIVVVEPDAVVASTIKEILNIEGYEAKAFTDPIQGLEAVLAEGPHLIIAAVVMSEVTGIELAVEAKRNYPDCKILLWSAMPAATDLNRMAQAQGYEFEILPKPIHPEVLLGKIREAVSGQLAAQGV